MQDGCNKTLFLMADSQLNDFWESKASVFFSNPEVFKCYKVSKQKPQKGQDHKEHLKGKTTGTQQIILKKSFYLGAIKTS